MRLSGYGAYSTKDGEFKGGGTVEYIFNNQPTSKLTFSGKHDVLQLGASENAFTTGNILSSIFSRGNNDKLTLINSFDVRYEKEWWQGFSNSFALEYRQMFPTKYVDFVRPNGEVVDQIHTTQFRLGTTFVLGTRLSCGRPLIKFPWGRISRSWELTWLPG